MKNFDSHMLTNSGLIIFAARGSAVKACRDIKGGNLESMNHGIRSGHKVEVLIKLENNLTFCFSQKEGIWRLTATAMF